MSAEQCPPCPRCDGARSVLGPHRIAPQRILAHPELDAAEPERRWFSSAVPPMCPKQRFTAVASGRSLAP
jgi:hypothetical protein